MLTRIIAIALLLSSSFALAEENKTPAPAQPTFTDQLYMIGRAQERQIEILQQELDKVRAELDVLKKNTTPATPSK